MNAYKVRLKYYVYGILFGFIIAFAVHMIYLGIALTDIREVLSCVIIDLAFFFVWFLLHLFFIFRVECWQYWCRHFQQSSYCLILLTGSICIGAFYYKFLSPYVGEYFANISATLFQFGVIIILTGSTVCLATLSNCKTHLIENEDEKSKNIVSDDEIADFQDDAFFEKKVYKFVDEFMKYPGACVFGIEGPWGVGKTSFSNLCCKSLEDKYHDMIVIYKFNPLNYEDSSKVLRNFYTGLISKIQEKHFEPELEALLTSYMDKIVAVVSEQSFWGMKFKLPISSCSEDEIIKKLQAVLNRLSYQIVVVIDDLDRLDFLTIKNIFFLMRNIFHFDKLKFIVCYDFENVIWSANFNLNSDNSDEEKIIEFVDKYINETCPLYFRPDKIRDYITELATKYMKLQPVKSTLWDSSIDAILNICVGKDFFYYQKFFGTPRRIKKILQQLLRVSYAVGDVDTTFDFTGIDLVNLLLIYLYYPRCFKKLYYTEMGAQRGIYSCMDVVSITDHKVQDAKIESVKKSIDNSKEYPESAKFLFKRLFANNEIFRHITHEQIYQRACFNRVTFFSSMGTLEKYLRLIVFSDAMDKNEVYSTYRNIICNEICTAENEGNLQAVFENHSEVQRTLWNAISDSMQTDLSKIYSVPLLQWLINIAIDQLPEYKLTSKLTSFHTKLIIYIRIILNELAQRNAQQVVSTIFCDSGVLHQLLYQNLGNYSLLMNIFDALYFKGIIDIRTEGNDIFPLNDALIHASEPEQSLMGMNTEDMAKPELREISQRIYCIFKEQFGNRNLWHEFNCLPLERMFEFPSGMSQSQLDVERKITSFKFKLFILCRFGDVKTGLAAYNLSGNGDGTEIRRDFSRYLIEHCFRVDNTRAYFDFMEFMIISIIKDNLKHVSIINNLSTNNNVPPIISPELLTVLMHPPILKSYWRTNRDTIMNSSVFDGEFFYVNEDTIVDARLVADYIGHSLDFWTSDEQAARWDSLP